MLTYFLICQIEILTKSKEYLSFDPHIYISFRQYFWGQIMYQWDQMP